MSEESIISKMTKNWLVVYDAATELAANERIPHRDAFQLLAEGALLLSWFNYNLLVELGYRIGWTNAWHFLEGFYTGDKKAKRYWKMLMDYLEKGGGNRDVLHRSGSGSPVGFQK